MDAVIFDMDGVLIDSERYWHAWEPDLFARALPDTVDPEAAMNDLVGMNYREMYDHLAERHDMDITKEEWIAAFDERAEEIYHEKISLLEGTAELLTALRENGLKTAIASSSPRHWIDLVVDRFGLRDLFDTTLSAEEIEGESKPAPDIYRRAADDLGVPPEACIVIEDSTHGVTAAKKAGMTCIGFRTPHNTDTDLSAADIIAHSDDLRETLLTRLQKA